MVVLLAQIKPFVCFALKHGHHLTIKVVLRFATTTSGALCVMTVGEQMMLKWLVLN